MPTSHPKSKKRPQASEMFSVRNGKRVDDHLHQPILDNPEADKTILSAYGQRLRQQGFSEESIKRLTSSEDPSIPPQGFAGGGAANPWSVGPQKHPRHPAGMIKSSIPGRTDKIPMSVPPGSYILPADIPSALGEGNTMAGSQILSKMFKIGPYGSGMTGQIKSGRVHMPRFDWMRMPRPMPKHYADGGPTEGGEDIPIIAAGGEMVLHPEQVREIGHGDLKAGHRVLDKFVVSVRKKNIETLKNLAPPKK